MNTDKSQYSIDNTSQYIDNGGARYNPQHSDNSTSYEDQGVQDVAKRSWGKATLGAILGTVGLGSIVVGATVIPTELVVGAGLIAGFAGIPVAPMLIVAGAIMLIVAVVLLCKSKKQAPKFEQVDVSRSSERYEQPLDPAAQKEQAVALVETHLPKSFLAAMETKYFLVNKAGFTNIVEAFEECFLNKCIQENTPVNNLLKPWSTPQVLFEKWCQIDHAKAELARISNLRANICKDAPPLAMDRFDDYMQSQRRKLSQYEDPFSDITVPECITEVNLEKYIRERIQSIVRGQ